MTDTKWIKKELEKFGLSDAQAEIYLCLVKNGELRIQEIVGLTKISRSSVYSHLAALFELGIAEEIIENSYKRVKAYPVGAMQHGLDDKIFKLEKLTTDLEKLEKIIQLPNPKSSGSTTLRAYKGRLGARQIFWNSLQAKGDTYVYSDWGRGRYVGVKFYESFVEEWRMRKLTEKVIINPTPQALESIRKYTFPNSPISRTRIEDIRAVDVKVLPIIGDTLIYNNIYAQIYLKNVKIQGFEIENNEFAASQRSIFETVWKSAKPISEYL